MVEWLTEKDSFTPLGSELYSLSTGRTSSAGDDISCDCAEEVGTDMPQHLHSASFMNVSFKQQDCVKTLQQLCKGVTVEKKTLFLHTTHLFIRLIALVERTNDMEPYFGYELTTLPAAIFKDSLMRKPDKAGLGNELTKHAVVEDKTVRGMFVLDGGSLLHKVKWPKVGTYHDVVMCYVRYVRPHFGSQAMIVFHGFVHHVQPGMAAVYILSVCRARNSMVSKLVSIQKVQESNGTSAVRQLLAIHVLTACDTACAVYSHGKALAFWKLVHSAETLPMTDTIASTTGTPDEVASAAMKVLVQLVPPASLWWSSLAVTSTTWTGARPAAARRTVRAHWSAASSC